MNIEKPRFLTKSVAEKIAKKFGTPCYVYDEASLERQAKSALKFPNAFGLTVRYAMKAASNRTILRLFTKLGLHMDASSGYEVERAMLAGVPAKNISLSSQQLPQNLKDLLAAGIKFNACSLRQLEEFGKLAAGSRLGVRINPGLGSGGTRRTNVGGPASSFGIWFEHIPQAIEIAKKYGLKIIRIHTHIGSGSDPKVWQKVASMSLNTMERFPDATVLDMGGGYKVGRMGYEKSTDLRKIGAPVAELVRKFAAKTGRKLHFEIEPGTYLLANCACLLAKVEDVCDTGSGGYDFIKLDTGMTDVLRPSIYGAQHPVCVLNNSRKLCEYIVCGHCCESGDILTPAPGNPEELAPRLMRRAQIGDLCAIDGAGAYCSSMSVSNYNSYPASPEVMIMKNGALKLMRKRQTLAQIVENEI